MWLCVALLSLRLLTRSVSAQNPRANRGAHEKTERFFASRALSAKATETAKRAKRRDRFALGK